MFYDVSELETLRLQLIIRLCVLACLSRNECTCVRVRVCVCLFACLQFCVPISIVRTSMFTRGCVLGVFSVWVDCCGVMYTGMCGCAC